MSDAITATERARRFAQLAEQLGAREPRFVECAWLADGMICWDVRLLPSVFVAPGVFAALQSLPDGKRSWPPDATPERLRFWRP